MTFTFCFLSSPLFSLFLPRFFSLAGHLVAGFILVGRVFRKAFRILGLGERKDRWAMEQDFHGDFQVNVTWSLSFFSGVLDWIVLILVWFERSLHSAEVSRQRSRWPIKLMTSQAVERTWIRTGSSGANGLSHRRSWGLLFTDLSGWFHNLAEIFYFYTWLLEQLGETWFFFGYFLLF